MYYVYLLISQKNKTYYIGQTNNLDSRFAKHNQGKVVYTKSRGPWKLVKYESYKTRAEARWREHVLKHNANERKKFYGG